MALNVTFVTGASQRRVGDGEIDKQPRPRRRNVRRQHPKVVRRIQRPGHTRRRMEPQRFQHRCLARPVVPNQEVDRRHAVQVDMLDSPKVVYGEPPVNRILPAPG